MGFRKLSPIVDLCSRATVRGLWIFTWVTRVSPIWAWNLFAWMVSRGFWYGLPRRRGITLDNLMAQGHSRREAARIGRQCYHGQFLVFLETLASGRVLSGRGTTLEWDVSPQAEEILAGLRSGEIPLAVAIGGHTGSWEIMGAALSGQIAPTPQIVAARLIKNEHFFRFSQEVRADVGLQAIDKKDTVRVVLRRLRAGEPALYSFISDQHFKRGLRLPFFGRPACTVTVPANIIARHDAPALLGHCRRLRAGHYRVRLEALDPALHRGVPKEDAILAILTDMHRFIEEVVAESPSQWTWGHRRWRDCCSGPSETAEGPAAKADAG